MPRKKKAPRVVRAQPPAMASASPPAERTKQPQREVIEIHTTRERRRNASGNLLDGSKANTLIPVLGGVVGGTAAVLASQKWNAHSGLVAAGTAAAGLAAMTMGKQPWLRQAGAGAVVGAAVVGAVPLVVSALSKSPQPASQAQAQPGKAAPAKRSADGERDADSGSDGFVTRKELNDALSQLADSHKDAQKQQTCDLLTALRDEIRKVVAEGPNGPGLPASSMAPSLTPPPGLPAKQPPSPVMYPSNTVLRTPFDLRGADGDDYSRNAYGDDIRDAEGDDYGRNAYGDDIRDAEGDEYGRNAYGDDLRDADGDDYGRNAYGDDTRDADGYEREADGYERDADGYERDADGYERDADGDEARNGACDDDDDAAARYAAAVAAHRAM